MYIAKLPLDPYIGQVIGSGQCVAFVQRFTGAPLTHLWKQGQLVKGATSLPPGSAIATFDVDGTYGNHTDGRSHAAIYLGQDDTGLQVMDAWLKQPVHRRTIFFGHKLPVNDGNLFFLIE